VYLLLLSLKLPAPIVALSARLAVVAPAALGCCVMHSDCGA
jgi:hypothetical protein